jgi:putative flippase GtrA
VRHRATAVRFAAVGVCNTAIDTVVFVLLHGALGITLANFVSTSAGMVFSFVVNGLFTFRAERLTMRHAALFVASIGLVMWVAQPLLIHGWLWVQPSIWFAKLASIGCSLALNFIAYRYVVWPVEHRGEETPARA